jgi:hypothetical protein
MLDKQLDVFLSILLSDLYFATSRLEFLDDLLAEALGLKGKVEVKSIN